MRNCLSLAVTEKKLSPERCSSVKNLKKTALCLLPEAERWQKIFVVNDLMARQTFISAHGLDLHQVQGKNEITTKFIKNTGQNFLSILLLKNFKM